MGTAESRLSGAVGALFHTAPRDAARTILEFARLNNDDLDVLEIEQDNMMGAAEWASQSRAWEMVLGFAKVLHSLLYRQGRWEFMVRYWSKAIEAARTTRDVVEELALMSQYAFAQAGLGRMQQAEAVQLQVINRAERMNMKPQLLGALFQLSADYADQGRFREAGEQLRKCIPLCEELDDGEVLAYVYSQLGNIALCQGKFGRATAMQQKSLEVWQQIEEMDGRAHTTLYALGRLCLVEGRCREAQEYLTRSLAIRERIGDQPGIAAVLSQLGIASVGLGELDLAETQLLKSLKLSEKQGDLRNIAHCRMALGELAHAQGNRREAQKHWESALLLTQESNLPPL